jgi:hypothetical protein
MKHFSLPLALAIALMPFTAQARPHGYVAPASSPIAIGQDESSLEPGAIAVIAAYAVPHPEDSVRMVNGVVAVPIMTCVSFVNEATDTATAIRFSFTFFDNFGSKTIRWTGDRLGTFAHGVDIIAPPMDQISGNVDSRRSCWNLWTTSIPSHITIGVDKVAYPDHVWPSNDAPDPVPLLPAAVPGR